MDAQEVHETCQNELRCWRDWAGDLDSAAVTPEGLVVLRWALDVVSAFYTDDWFVRMASRFSVPVMRPGEWPLSTPPAVIRLVERAARIALLPKAIRGQLSSAISSSNDPELFLHMDVVFEVASFALREGWLVESEVPISSGKIIDLRITRRGMAFAIEVTRLGTDREFRKTSQWWDALHAQILMLASHSGVLVSGSVDEVLDEGETHEILKQVGVAVAATAGDRQIRAIQARAVSLAILPDLADRGAGLAGPSVGGDPWGQLECRLTEKAKQTDAAGSTWLRVDAQNGMFVLTPWAQYEIGDQLAILTRYVRRAVSDFPHVRGVIISNGAALDLHPHSRDVDGELEDSGRLTGTSPRFTERSLPGRRRRRTLTIPTAGERLLLPKHVELEPARWYASEPHWIDWALHQLGCPALMRILRPQD